MPSSTNSIINCIGDSHTSVFRTAKKLGLLNPLRVRLTTVQGATVFGLANPNSQTNAMKIFKRELRFVPKTQPITVLLGEVDCGFLVWTRAKKYSTSVEEQLDISITRYEEFMNFIQNQNFKHVSIFSVPPPTIPDNGQIGLVADQRKGVSATIKERTQLTKKYNQRLSELTRKHGFSFLDIFDCLIDETTGLVRSDLLNPDPTDHHLDPKLAAPIYAKALREWASTP